VLARHADLRARQCKSTQSCCLDFGPWHPSERIVRSRRTWVPLTPCELSCAKTFYTTLSSIIIIDLSALTEKIRSTQEEKQRPSAIPPARICAMSKWGNYNSLNISQVREGT
jgi:hypothetical protein